VLFLVTIDTAGIDTGNEWFRRLTKRGSYYDSDVIPVSTFLFYFGSNILGMIYVNISNLTNYRRNPVLNKFANYNSLLAVLVLTPLLFVTSTMMVLRSKDSLSDLACSEQSDSCVGRPFSWYDCYKCNVFAWTGGYVYGLCITYWKLCKLKNFHLVPSQMRLWSYTNWSVFSAVLSIALAATFVSAYCYVQAGLFIVYSLLLLLFFVYLAVRAYLQHDTHTLHVHHYNIGMLFLVMITCQNYFLAIFSGIANGWMIEGVTTYSFDPMFKVRVKPKKN
jgi:hypothetical protein